MDFNKKIKILGSVLASLVLLFIISLIISPSNVQKKQLSRNILKDLAVKDVNEIILASKDKTVTIKSDGKNHVLDNDGKLYPANSSNVTGFLNILADLKSSRNVAKSSKLWDRFSLTDDMADKLIIRTAKGEKVLYVSGAAGSHDYARNDRSENVYEITEKLSDYFTKDADYWIDLKLFNNEISSDDVMELDIKADVSFADNSRLKTDYTILKTVKENIEKWVFRDFEIEADQGKIDSLVKAVTGLEANKMLLENKKDAFSKISAEIVFKTNSSTYSVLVGASVDNNQFYIKSGSDDYIYLISEWGIKRIIKDLKDIEKK